MECLLSLFAELKRSGENDALLLRTIESYCQNGSSSAR